MRGGIYSKYPGIMKGVPVRQIVSRPVGGMGLEDIGYIIEGSHHEKILLIPLGRKMRKYAAWNAVDKY